jgi:sulfur-oxidizing protein SoxB
VRISDMRLDGKPIDADRQYRVAGWAPVAPGARGEPICDVVEQYFKANPVVKARQLNQPALVGTDGNPGRV